MTVSLGRNINSNAEANVVAVEINSLTATTVALPNDKRIHLSICLEPDLSVGNLNAFIRLYPAADDNDKIGEVLTRVVTGNDSLFRPSWSMSSDNMYHGEISLISDFGTFDVYITEY